MDTTENFSALHYAARARDYVTSAVHSAGADLDELEAALAGQGAARVLDLGCGGGHVSYRAAAHVAAVTAYDITPAMLAAVADEAAARGLKNIATAQGPAEAMPFGDASFDIVLSRFTTHHWQDMEAGLREARRVLAPGGFAIFIDSFAPARPMLDTHLQAVEVLRDASHGRNYSLSEWMAALARAGFAVERVTTRRLRMEFAVWTARTNVPPETAAAIRRLQEGAAPEVKAHFAIGADGSFDLDCASFFARRF